MDSQGKPGPDKKDRYTARNSLQPRVLSITVFLSLLIGALAGAGVVAAWLPGRSGRPSGTLRGFVVLAAVIPFLWWWARSTDQFPATFGILTVVEIAGQTYLGKRAQRIGNT